MNQNFKNIDWIQTRRNNTLMVIYQVKKENYEWSERNLKGKKIQLEKLKGYKLRGCNRNWIKRMN